jgi:SAM-dependent methyltransferase
MGVTKEDYDDPAFWASQYEARNRNPVSPTFGQMLPGYLRDTLAFQEGLYLARRDAIIEAFSMDATHRILIAGCGHGWLIETFVDLWGPNVDDRIDQGGHGVYGIDYSAHISDRRGVEARGDIVFVEDDIRGGGRVRAALRQATGDDVFHFIVSESMMEGYNVPSPELTQILDAAEAGLESSQPLTNIVHMVTVDVNPPWTRLSLPEWKAVRPTHSWMSNQSFEVL